MSRAKLAPWSPYGDTTTRTIMELCAAVRRRDEARERARRGMVEPSPIERMLLASYVLVPSRKPKEPH